MSGNPDDRGFDPDTYRAEARMGGPKEVSNPTPEERRYSMKHLPKCHACGHTELEHMLGPAYSTCAKCDCGWMVIEVTRWRRDIEAVEDARDRQWHDALLAEIKARAVSPDVYAPQRPRNVPAGVRWIEDALLERLVEAVHLKCIATWRGHGAEACRCPQIEAAMREAARRET